MNESTGSVMLPGGTRAIGRVRQQSPQMLCLDIGLPDMDGYELARRLRVMPETTDAVFVAVNERASAREAD